MCFHVGYNKSSGRATLLAKNPFVVQFVEAPARVGNPRALLTPEVDARGLRLLVSAPKKPVGRDAEVVGAHGNHLDSCRWWHVSI